MKSHILAGLMGTACLIAIPASAEVQAYEFDKTHTTIRAGWMHQGFSKQFIHFTDYDGELMLDMEDPSNSSIEVTFDLDDGFWVGADQDKFIGHLSSPDLFNLEEYPTAKFVATSFETEDGETGTMTGDLTLLGITKPVTLDVTLNKAGEAMGATKAGFSATGTIMRSDWGMDYAVPVVSDELDIVIETELVKVEDDSDEGMSEED